MRYGDDRVAAFDCGYDVTRRKWFEVAGMAGMDHGRVSIKRQSIAAYQRSRQPANQEFANPSSSDRDQCHRDR